MTLMPRSRTLTAGDFLDSRDTAKIAARTTRSDTATTLEVVHQVERLISSVARLIDSVVHLLRRNDAQKKASAEPKESRPRTQTPTSTSRPLSEKLPQLDPLHCPGALTPPSNLGVTLAQSNEFLWKPISEKDKKLAILLPATLTGKIESVQILTPKGRKVIETGRFTGVGNGDRAHFRFDKSGGAYPDGAILLITLLDGTKRHIVIKETNARLVK
jgi:hypothetical protein